MPSCEMLDREEIECTYKRFCARASKWLGKSTVLMQFGRCVVGKDWTLGNVLCDCC